MNTVRIENKLDESNSSFYIEVPNEEFIIKWKTITSSLSDIDTHISTLLENNPSLLDFSKWGSYLPKAYQIKLLKNKYFDIQQTKELLDKIEIINNELVWQITLLCFSLYVGAVWLRYKNSRSINDANENTNKPTITDDYL